MNPFHFYNLEDSDYHQSNPNYDNSQFCSSQVPVTETFETSESTGKQARAIKWNAAEDVALMSAWCLASENSVVGKNQRKTSLWSKVKELYDATLAENPEKIGKRNEDQMRGRWKRLNENAQKWVAAYREAYRNKTSGMGLKDIESNAHAIYEGGGSKFNDSIVFNEVMCKHVKWDLQVDHELTRSRSECEVEESGGSTKRSRTSDEGDYSNAETPNTGGSTIQRPMGRDATKRKGKGKISNEFVDELRAMRLSRETDQEIMKKKIEFDHQKEQNMKERDQNTQEMKKMEMQMTHLNTLLLKDHLSPEEENMKRFLISKFYGN